MRKTDVNQPSFRLIPSHFPPIQLFENLLDPDELEAAYLLESLTNDRLRDEVGDISLVAPEDRLCGPGTTVIMAAFTHAGAESRFTRGRYGVYYAGLDLHTAIAESSFSRARFLSATDEPEQVITMRCYHCHVSAPLVDVRANDDVHTPDSFSGGQAMGEQLKKNNEYGALYRSARHPGGECVALFRPKALVPPATQGAHFQFHWNGRTIAHVSKISEQF